MEAQEFINLCKTGDLIKLKETLDDDFDFEEYEFKYGEINDHPLCNAKNGDVVDLLFEYDGADVLFDNEETPIIHYVIDAVIDNEIEMSVLEQVAEYDDSLNRDWDGNSGDYTIHKAVRTGNLDVVKIILEAGSNTNILSNDGDTPIGIAAQKGNKEIVELLIEYGSPTKAADFEFLIEFDDEDDIPDVEEPIDLAATDEIKNILLGASVKLILY